MIVLIISQESGTAKPDTTVVAAWEHDSTVPAIGELSKKTAGKDDDNIDIELSNVEGEKEDGDTGVRMTGKQA